MIMPSHENTRIDSSIANETINNLILLTEFQGFKLSVFYIILFDNVDLLFSSSVNIS